MLIEYPKPTRRRHKPADMTPKPRHSSVAEALGWGSGLLVSLLATHAAGEGLSALLDAYTATTPGAWFGAAPLRVSVFILSFALCAALFKAGVMAAMNITINRERDRAKLDCELYTGPGLKGYPRLER